MFSYHLTPSPPRNLHRPRGGLYHRACKQTLPLLLPLAIFVCRARDPDEQHIRTPSAPHTADQSNAGCICACTCGLVLFGSLDDYAWPADVSMYTRGSSRNENKVHCGVRVYETSRVYRDYDKLVSIWSYSSPFVSQQSH